MKPIATLANGAWLATSLPAWRRYRRALQDPDETQKRILSRILTANAGCSYGDNYRFHEIDHYARFRERVPVVDHTDLEPWIARIVAGEPRVLTRETVSRLVPTSGSTTGRKLIPYTPAFQRELNAAIGPWIVDLCRQHPSIPFGPAYWSISPAIPASSNEKSAVPIGFDDDSAYLGGLKQRIIDATLAVPSSIRHVRDAACARYLTLLCLLREPDLRLVSVWHPSFLALLLGALPGWWEELLDDLESGRCSRAREVPPHLQRVTRAAPQRRRAHELRKLTSPDPRVLWPRLGVVSCWGDGQAALPLADLQRRLPGTLFQSKGLLATEAFVSIPFEGCHPIAITSHFFEFQDANGEIHLTSELRPGQSYAVIVTTAGGLYRYRLGDFVEVDGFVGTTPSVRFLGRGDSTSDLCGEKLTEAFVTQAIASVCASCRFVTPFAMLAPTVNGADQCHYTLFAEGNVPPELIERLDEKLRENPHYALCRDLGQLGALSSFRIARNAYEVFCRTLTISGRRFGDIKPQALSTRTDWHLHFEGVP